jgi:hypothetical protein
VSACSLRGDALSVYNNRISGELDEDYLTYSTSTLVLSIFFSLMVIILLLNVVVALVTDSYGDIKNKGDASFWKERFGFVAEMETLIDCSTCGCSSRRRPLREGENYYPLNYGISLRWDSMVVIV